MRALVCLGDKTTFGFVVSATTTWSEDGKAIARTGDLATCSKCKGAFPLIGTAYDWREEHDFVATGDQVACRCPDHVVYGSTTHYSHTPAPQTLATRTPTPVAASAAQSSDASTPATSRYDQPQRNPSYPQGMMAEVKAQKPSPELVEYYDPGFYIVPKSTTLAKLKSQLFTTPIPAVLDKFRSLNPDLGEQVKAGQMIVLSDPTNTQCTEAEALLMAAASRVSDILQDMTSEEADFMTLHREEIESFLSFGSTSMGVAEVALAKHMDSIRTLLLDIDKLHSDTLARHGHLKSEEFFAKRKQLLSNLDRNLNGLTKQAIGFPDHPKLKTALGISSRSLVHQYRLAGGFQQSPGYATHLEGVAKASKYIKYGGYVGIAVGGTASAMKVQGVCAQGDEEACERVKFTQAGAFVGGLVGGALGGAAFGTGAPAICAALGVPSGGLGTVACAAVITAGGSFVVGTAFEKGVESSAEMIYEGKK